MQINHSRCLVLRVSGDILIVDRDKVVQNTQSRNKLGLLLFGVLGRGDHQAKATLDDAEDPFDNIPGH